MSVDGVVPFAVEVMGREGHVSKFGVGDLHAFRIPLGVVGGSDRESGLGAGRGDEFDLNTLDRSRFSNLGVHPRLTPELGENAATESTRPQCQISRYQKSLSHQSGSIRPWPTQAEPTPDSGGKAASVGYIGASYFP